jgi:hypothetical protein
MINRWGINLRKTNLTEKRLTEEQLHVVDLEQKQMTFKDIASENTLKIGEYKDRQASLAADAMSGQQGKKN